MKILIVGSNKPWATERHFVGYLQQLGAEVYLYSAPDIVFDNHSRNLMYKILFKTKIWTGYKEVNDGLLEVALALKPDIIWIWKGMEIYPQTLKALKNQGLKLANFNPDHPFIITSAGSGNKNVTDSVGLYDLHFCYHRKLIMEIEKRFKISTVFLPFAYDENDISYLEPSKITEVKKICFQGNPDSYRVGIIETLAQKGYEVDVYGHDWQKTRLAGKKNISLFPIASRPDFWRKNQEYRIQLNLFRQYNQGSHNMRTFEIPAVGGIELSEFSEEQAEFFKDGEEIFLFRGSNDLLGKVEFILNLPESRIQIIRRNARTRSLESNYSFKDRASTVFEIFKKIID